MSQSLYTAMGGITAATTQIQVVSDNVANINTTAHKASSVNFSDVYSTTISSGSVATKSTGGTNPIQVGVGTQVSAITKDYSVGSAIASGSDTDLMIQGQGFFTVTDGSSTYYTRAGKFSFDSGGNLVTSEGYQVLGTNAIMTAQTTGTTVSIPLTICAEVKGTNATTLSAEKLTALNGLGTKTNITKGSFDLTITSGSSTYTGRVTALDNITTDTTVGETVAKLNAAGGLNFTDANGNTISGMLASVVDGKISIDTTNAKVTTGGVTTPLAVSKLGYTTVGIDPATNFAAATALDTASLTAAATTNITAGDFTFTVTDSTTPAAVSYSKTVTIPPLLTTPQQIVDFLNGASGLNGVTTVPAGVISGAKATLTNGIISINASSAKAGATAGTTTAATVIATAPVGGGSNFAAKTSITGLTSVTNAADTVAQTKTLDSTVGVSALSTATNSISKTNITTNADGSIQVTYDDGSVLSVELSGDTDKYSFVYTTKDNVQITGEKCDVDENVATEGNFVIQMATVTNVDGMLSKGSSLYSVGPNSGDVVYTVAGQMGVGKVKSGYLESSNVDLSKELSSMILAQRAIQANSRVFTTTSNIMDTIVQMGR